LRAHAEELGIDSNRIAVMGGSAGGHRSLMVAYTGDNPTLTPSQPYPGISDKVSCVIDFYGITDIGSRKKTDSNGNPTEPRGVESEVQAIFGSTPAEWKKASPVGHLRKDLPPTLILHGKKDTTVDRDQSQLLAEELKKVGAEYELVWLNQAGHSFSLRYGNAKEKKDPLEKDLTPVVLRFLKKHL
jgi:acetyl esterase/lipase